MKIRMTKVGTGVVATTLAVAGVVAGPIAASAQVNGQIQTSASTWVAQVYMKDPIKGLTTCSGVVISDGYVLTAAHCVTFSTGKQATPASMSVTLGKTTVGSGRSYSVTSVARPANYSDEHAADVGVIHVSGFPSGSADALPLAFEPSVINRVAGVTFYGYGETQVPASHRDQPLQKSQQGAYVRQPSCDGFSKTTFICYAPGSNTTVKAGANSLDHGDSGSGALVWQSGAWQVAAVADTIDYDPVKTKPAPRVGATSMIGAGPSGYSTMSAWIRSAAAIPAFAPGTIVRNPANGASWLVEADGYRNWISTGGDYNCLVSQGHPVVNTAQISIDTTPDRVGTWATSNCGGGTGGGTGGGGTSSGGTVTLSWGSRASASICGGDTSCTYLSISWTGFSGGNHTITPYFDGQGNWCGGASCANSLVRSGNSGTLTGYWAVGYCSRSHSVSATVDGVGSNTLSTQSHGC